MSRVLLDTHLLLWWLKDDPRLPTSLVTELQTGQHDVLISQASLLEMTIKVNLGRMSVDLTVLKQRFPPEGFQWLPISDEHLLVVNQLDAIEVRSDHFDRLLVAQCRVEPLLLFTCDRALQAYRACLPLITKPARPGRASQHCHEPSRRSELVASTALGARTNATGNGSTDLGTLANANGEVSIFVGMNSCSAGRGSLT